MRAFAVALSLTWLAPVYAVASFQEQKPVRQTEFHFHGAPPLSLDDLWAQAPVVIEGVVVAAHPADQVVPGSPDIVLVYTNYSIRVEEVFKADAVVTNSTPMVFVLRMGGTRDRGDHIHKHVETDVPAFEVGERYILFLAPLSGTNTGRYAMAGAPGEGAFLVRGLDLEPRGKSDVAASFASNPSLLRILLRSKGGAR